MTIVLVVMAGAVFAWWQLDRHAPILEPCDECNAEPGEPCAWACTARPA